MNEKEGELQQTPIVGEELEIRKKKIISFLKRKKDWAYYLILSFIIWIGVYIRTRNIPRLKDIATGTWTLGPDLDPFLFLRWAKYIVEHGSLMAHDVMRYVPLGYNTSGEMKLLAYMMVWCYKILNLLPGFTISWLPGKPTEMTITYAAILFPVIMFALTTIAFFLFARKIFYKESKKIRNIIGLIATSLFVIVPSLMPRTIAGIPEKESAGFFFMFLAFYFFIEAFTSKKFKNGLIWGLLAGIATASMALVWGGMAFIFYTIPTAVLLAFIFGKIKKNEFFIYSLWLFSSFALMMFFSTRYSVNNLVTSTSTGMAIGVFIAIGISLLIFKTEKFTKKRREIKFLRKLPKELSALIIAGLVVLMIVLLTLGPGHIFGRIISIKNSLVSPQTSRFGLTVAENKQPYFASEWKGEFGPVYFNIPLFFWMFIIGSVLLFNNLIKKLSRKERLVLTFSYLIFIISLIFSRYSPESVLNGDSFLSLIFYFGGMLFFIGLFFRTYFKKYKDGDFYEFREFNFTYILYFLILTLGIIAARGSVRLIMLLGAVSPVAIAFLIVRISQRYFKEKGESMKLFIGIIAIIIIISALFTFWFYYQQEKNAATNFVPGGYQWQWQNAMKWVRDNTALDSVFAHWWDYGYWVQSLGERATILDGGNGYVYWNHLMGRHVLTGTNEMDAIEFLYAHKGTHLLIDSTEIGKYTAYSSIGADENYDRFSWIPTFSMDKSQTRERSDGIFYLYSGGTMIDDDIIWGEEGNQIFLPKQSAVLGAIIIGKDHQEELIQPEAFFGYNGNQHMIPLRYAYYKDELYDFGSGLDAGIFLFPKVEDSSDGGIDLNEIGAALYLSGRTIHSHFANLYLFNQPSDYFKLVHTESSIMIDNMKQQGADYGEFIYYGGFQGPIKIWELNYPTDIELKTEYLETWFPNPEVYESKTGEY